MSEPTTGEHRALAIAEKADEMVRANPDLRRGQAMFNALHTLDPALADHLRGGTCDPFHRDDRIGAFLNAVKAGLPVDLDPAIEAEMLTQGRRGGSTSATPDAGDASEPLSECQMYDEPGQTCLTAGPQVVAAEGLCGPCAVRELAAAATRARAEAWDEGFGTGVAYERDRGQWFPPIQRPDNPHRLAPDTAGEVTP